MTSADVIVVGAGIAGLAAVELGAGFIYEESDEIYKVVAQDWLLSCQVADNHLPWGGGQLIAI